MLPGKSFFIEVDDDRVIGSDDYIQPHVKLEVYKRETISTNSPLCIPYLIYYTSITICIDVAHHC